MFIGFSHQAVSVCRTVRPPNKTVMITDIKLSQERDFVNTCFKVYINFRYCSDICPAARASEKEHSRR